MKNTLLEKIDLFLLSEGKVTVSPYLKSVMAKQDEFTDDDIEKLQKGLSNVKGAVSIAISSPYTKGGKYIIVNSEEDAEYAERNLKRIGYTVTNTKNDGGKVFIYFK